MVVVRPFTRLAIIVNYCQDTELSCFNYHCSWLFSLWMQQED